MPGMRTLLLFDIDGTLLDAAGAGRTAFYLALRHLFPDRRFPEISMAGRTDHGLWHEFTAGEERFETFLELYGAHLQEQLSLSLPRQIPGAQALLEEIARHPDLVPCLVTGNIREGARHKLEALGWWQHFENAGGWGTWGDDMPTKLTLASRLLEAWSARHPGEPFRALFLGDTMADLEAARHARIPCLVINGNLPEPEFRAAGACEVWNDFDGEASRLVARLRALASAPIPPPSSPVAASQFDS